MNRFVFIFIGIASAFITYRCSILKTNRHDIQEIKWPKPVYDFSSNSISQVGFELGRKLFYDPILSRDSSVSCATCHLQYTGFAHVDHAVSHGIDGRKGTRNAPALINLSWKKFFHWDGGVNHIDVQAINPITSSLEMDNTLEEVIRRLSSNEEYKYLFQNVFSSKEITTAQIMTAITQFTRSLISQNSKYDKVMRKEEGYTFTEQEKNGLQLFRNHCASCHQEPLFTVNKLKCNGLPMNPLINDVGRYAITGNPEDSLMFMIPTLRNIEYTFPYMHDGRFKKLKEVINYYCNEIDTRNTYLSKELQEPIRLSSDDQKDLLAFLLTLTDKDFLFDPKFSYPKN